jgi:hypothetical protein
MVLAAALLIAGVMVWVQRPDEAAGGWLLGLASLAFLWGVMR